MKGLCCECIHYLHGVVNEPCAKHNKRVGYLKEGCWRWETNKDAEEKEMPTKKCAECGQVLPIEEFYANAHSKDRLSACCKKCKPWQVLRKRK
jgi:hypothetical protein